MSKVVVGMSGGVDSAVAAYLLKEQGHDVFGVTLRTWMDSKAEVSKCCEIDDARDSARKIGIPYHVHNVAYEFKKYVTDPFVSEYLRGRTPNPCVVCNPHVKWEGMMYALHLFDASYVATGHYAGIVKLENGRYTLKQSDDREKDQTYMLYRLSQEHLEKTMMPLFGMTKDDVRAVAEKTGLSVAHKDDSQEICFVDDHYSDYVRQHAEDVGIKFCGEGNFVDEAGNILGTHKGITCYTIGQRKGLGIAFGHPVFVKEIRPDTNEVVLSDEDAVFTRTVICDNVCFMSIPDLPEGSSIPARVRIRYRHNGEQAVIMRRKETVRIEFEKPVRAATPGQSAVFYDSDDCVIGGGIITGTE